VDSLARPGGNVTGFSNFEYGLSGKWLELLKEVAARVTRAAVLRNAAISAGIGHSVMARSISDASRTFIGVNSDAIHVAGRLPVLVKDIGSIGHEATGNRE
jgi:putative ABC transport system substrate-binding protein